MVNAGKMAINGFKEPLDLMKILWIIAVERNKKKKKEIKQPNIVFNPRPEGPRAYAEIRQSGAYRPADVSASSCRGKMLLIVFQS